jgi:hypothetical protein
MGIDRIGKGGVPPTAPGGVEQKGPAEKAFSVEGASPKERVEGADAVESSSPLARLRRGEIDVNGYVDAKVAEATHGLQGLSPVELDAIRKVLRDQAATDPALVDLVRQSTGKVPSVPEE